MEPIVLKFNDFTTLLQNNRIYYYEGTMYFDFHFLSEGRIIKSRVFKRDIDSYERFFSNEIFYGAMRILFNIKVPSIDVVSEIRDGAIFPVDIQNLQDEDKMTLTINDDLSGLLYLRVGAGAKVETKL